MFEYGEIILNGKSSKEFGVFVEHPPGYTIPERDYETVHVPGRNGDLIFDKGGYNNTKRTYELAITGQKGTLYQEPIEFTTKVYSFCSWIRNTTGYYVKLEDSYNPEYYWMAMYKGGQDIENILGKVGRVTIEFDCMPQRFLKKDNSVVISFSSGQTCLSREIKNPGDFPSYPLIVAKGNWGKFDEGADDQDSITIYNSTYDASWNISFNGNKALRSPNDQAVNPVYHIDCDLTYIYDPDHYELLRYSNTSTFRINGDGFPKLLPGTNTITIRTTGTNHRLQSVTIDPRWWTI